MEKQQRTYLSDREECCTENNVTNWPSVLECSEHEDQLRDDVNERADEGPENVDNPKTDGVVVFETSELLEGGDRDEESDTPDEETCYPEELR
jgi:hypothetical protein